MTGEGTELMNRLQAAQEEARLALRFATKNGRWPEGLSQDAAQVLAREPQAWRLNEMMNVESRLSAFAERHDWKTSDSAWGRANRAFAGLFTRKK